MSQIEIRQVSADDHAAWLPLWQAYLRFYNTELPEAVSQSTWQRMLDPREPTHAALAWADGKAVGMVQLHLPSFELEHRKLLLPARLAGDARNPRHRASGAS